MKVPKEKIEMAASQDKDRNTLRNVLLENKKLIATDGKIMAIIPAETDGGDVDGMIPVSAFTSSRQLSVQDIRVGKKSVIVKKNKDGIDRIVCIPKFVDGVYPQWGIVEKESLEKPPVFEITINPELIYRLAHALGFQNNKNQGLNFKFYGNRKIVRVEFGKDRIGYLMPMNVQETGE